MQQLLQIAQSEYWTIITAGFDNKLPLSALDIVATSPEGATPTSRLSGFWQSVKGLKINVCVCEMET